MTSAQLAAVLAAIPGAGTPIQVRTNATRAAAVKHRSAITAIDMLAAPALAVLTDVPGGGGLAFGTNYKAAIAAGNVYGVTLAGSIGNVTTSADALNTHAITIPVAQTANATTYHVFLSTDAAPKYVAQITEAQRAAGCTVTAMGTVTATSPGAGIVQVNAVGTGVATGSAPFAVATAVDPTGITPLSCVGYSKAHVYFVATTSDLRSQPSLGYLALDALQGIAGQYGTLVSGSLTLVASITVGLAPMITTVPVDGSTGLVIAITTIAGQGTSVDVWVELE